MAVILVVDDGKSIYASNIAVSEMYERISHEIDGGYYPKFKRWLWNIAQRPAPFLDIDLRHLSAGERVEFWRAAIKVHELLEP